MTRPYSLPTDEYIDPNAPPAAVPAAEPISAPALDALMSPTVMVDGVALPQSAVDAANAQRHHQGTVTQLGIAPSRAELQALSNMGYGNKAGGERKRPL